MAVTIIAGVALTDTVRPAGATAIGTITTIAGGRTATTPAGAFARLAQPRTAAVDDHGDVYFTDTYHHQIRRLDGRGVVTTIVGSGQAGGSGDGGPATAASLDTPHGVAVDNRGHVYIADSANHRIRMVDLAGGTIRTVAGTGQAGFSGDGGPATGARLNRPRFLVVAPDGSLIVADTGNYRVRRVDPAGEITTIAGTGQAGYSGDGGPAIGAPLDDPRGLAFDDAGNLYVSNAEGSPVPSVRRIDPAGVITTVAGGRPAGFAGDGGPATDARLNEPRSIAIWRSTLYVADSLNNRVRAVDLRTGIIDTIAGTGAGSFGGDGGPAPGAELGQPRGVAVMPDGDVIVVDTNNDRLRRIDADGSGAPAGNGGGIGDGGGGFDVRSAPGGGGDSGVPSSALGFPSPSATGSGYRLAASDGGIFSFGDAGFFGSAGGLRLNRPIVGIAAAPSRQGYWLVASDGGIFSFGDAAFQGSTGDIHLNRPIVGLAATVSGRGYWLVASDGGIFSFGDAAFHGSTGDLKLQKPIVGMAATPSGRGYWLVASDGGIFSFGDAAFHGSPAATAAPGGKLLVAVAISASPTGRGYRVAAADGTVVAFGDAAFLGSAGGAALRLPVVGMAG